MILDPSKVLIAYNSDDASGDSQTVAEYYASARGIPSGNVQGYAFGTSNTIAYADTAAFRAGALTDIQTFIDANSSEGVVLSINCPYQAQLTNGTADTDYSAVCKVVGNCWPIVTTANTHPNITVGRKLSTVDNANGSNSGSYQTWRRYRPATGASRATVSNGVPSWDWRNATLYGSVKTIPCGRLGYHTGMTDSVAIAESCIDDAVWFELYGDVPSSKVLCGFSTRGGDPATYAPLTWGNVYDAWRRLTAAGVPCETYDGNSGDAAGDEYAADNWSFSKPSITITDQKTWLTGGGPEIELWGWIGTGLENVGSVYLPSVSFSRGAWMYESTSSNVSRYALTAGACCTIGPTREPTTSGLHDVGGLVELLLRGYSMMEAEMCSHVVAAVGTYERYCEVWGDPLYSPLASLGYKNKNAVSADAGTN